MAVATKSRRIPLGPWGITVRMRAEHAEAVRNSLPYRTVVRPALTRLEQFSARIAGQYANGPHQEIDPEVLPAGAMDTPEVRAMWRRVAAVKWYHSIDLGHGLVTPGNFDHRLLLDRYHFPARLDGRRALDVACFDGFWAFEMERRGAREVVALDIERWSDLDLPPIVKDAMVRAGGDGLTGAGFAVAHDLLQSKVRRQILSVYELTPERVGGTFDFTFCGDLLLHLMNPPKALQGIRAVTSGEALLVDVFDPQLDAIADYPVMRYFGGWQICHWWKPSLRCLVQMVKDAGFKHVDVLDKFQLAESGGDLLWRAVIRARP
ncbi:MAG TPA: methyltransferase domain-containing protein [Chloroflexota bacterium]|nr:methyltransferase domain-containing protein [Chloroflexota bacterium]